MILAFEKMENVEVNIFAKFNPYKTGPSGEPIKTGLLGRFPTLRKDDSDVESRRPPPSPPPGPAGYLIVGGLFLLLLGSG